LRVGLLISSSENPQKAKFAEFPFHALRSIEGRKKGRSCFAPASMLERTVGIDPTPPYRKYDALQSCVGKNRAIPY
jgi:hypothetical protein